MLRCCLIYLRDLSNAHAFNFKGDKMTNDQDVIYFKVYMFLNTRICERVPILTCYLNIGPFYIF